MSIKFFAKQDQDRLLNKFKGIFEKNKDFVIFDAYERIYLKSDI